MAGHQRPADSSKDQWVGMITAAVEAGKVFQRVHVVTEPLTDYLRYELGWSYPPNVEAGEDIRILPAESGRWPSLPRHDYWLFDSSDLWIMEYADDGTFRWIERIDDPGQGEREQNREDVIAVSGGSRVSRAAARTASTTTTGITHSPAAAMTVAPSPAPGPGQVRRERPRRRRHGRPGEPVQVPGRFAARRLVLPAGLKQPRSASRIRIGYRVRCIHGGTGHIAPPGHGVLGQSLQDRGGARTVGACES